MTASTPYRYLGKATSDDQTLALKMFSGTVLEAFRNSTLLWDNQGTFMATKHMASGKSAQWPLFADDPTPIYHTPGDFLAGQNIPVSEVVVNIDDILINDVDVAKEDVDISHFDVFSPYAMKLGRGIARDLDKKAIRVGLDAARTGSETVSSVNIHNGGNRVTRAVGSTSASITLAQAYPNSTTGATNFLTDLGNLARLMDEDNVPEAGRSLLISPWIRMVLGNNTAIFDRDYNSAAFSGERNKRILGNVEGFDVFYTNHLPSTDETGTSGGMSWPAKYLGNFTGVQNSSESYGLPAALALCGAQEGQAAIGSVMADGMSSSMDWDHRRNTWHLVSQIHLGLGKIAPYCAGEIAVLEA